MSQDDKPQPNDQLLALEDALLPAITKHARDTHATIRRTLVGPTPKRRAQIIYSLRTDETYLAVTLE